MELINQRLGWDTAVRCLKILILPSDLGNCSICALANCVSISKQFQVVKPLSSHMDFLLLLIEVRNILRYIENFFHMLIWISCFPSPPGMELSSG